MKRPKAAHCIKTTREPTRRCSPRTRLGSQDPPAGHNPTFFTISASNKRRPPVYTLHLKCFPIKGELCLVDNISYIGYSPPKYTCNGYVPHIHIHIQSKNMQFLLWNPTCPYRLSSQLESLPTPITMPRPMHDKIHYF